MRSPERRQPRQTCFAAFDCIESRFFMLGSNKPRGDRMSRRIAAKITGVSGYVPPRVMTNADLEKLVETDDAWIRERTGIRERHVAGEGVGASDLATAAARQLLAARNVPPSEIDLFGVARFPPD